MGRQTGGAKRACATRAAETEAGRVGRVEESRVRTAENRENEDIEARSARLEAVRVRAAERWENEDVEARAVRLKAKRVRTAENRENEDVEAREARVEAERLRIARRDDVEEGHRAERLEANRVRNAELRASQDVELNRAERELVLLDEREHAEDEDRQVVRLNQDRPRVRARRRGAVRVREGAALTYDKDDDFRSIGNVGELGAEICQCCSAKKFPKEPPGICCKGGKVSIPTIAPPPEPLKSLLTNKRFPNANHFRALIRSYNNCLQMTSFQANVTNAHEGCWSTFKVQGQICHKIGTLLGTPSRDPVFLQTYFVADDERQAELRGEHHPRVKQAVLLLLQGLMHEVNPYVKRFKTAVEAGDMENYKVVIRADKRPAGEHERRFNPPAADDIGVLIVGQEVATRPRDIVLQVRGRELQYVSETHRSYDALQYPLLFPFGDDGYTIDIAQTGPNAVPGRNKTVSSCAFYSYRLMDRLNETNYLLFYGQLLSQFMTDMYARSENERLRFLRFNQKKLRASEYIHLQDALEGEKDPSSIGRIFLPSSFTGGKRYMQDKTQDAMTYVRELGKPSLFITMTCNPKCAEIQSAMFPGQRAQERHDIVARVMQLKITRLIQLLTVENIFGPTSAHMLTIEWQKRDLPHGHKIVWLKTVLSAAQIDLVISAELPDPDTDPELHRAVLAHMIHGPCGEDGFRQDCIKDGKCERDYPKPYVSETVSERPGFPLYRRRSPEEGGREATIQKRGKSYRVTNADVVPYNPYLLRAFDCHLNVEVCQSVDGIKYITKYINKGSDQAVFGFAKAGEEGDEIKQYQTARYIGSNEACWRTFGFPIHHRYPFVEKLVVHLENGQRVHFTPQTARQVVDVPQHTSLTAFFHLCQSDDFARTLTYIEVPAYYTFSNKRFKRRKQGTPVEGHPGVVKTDTIGRIYTIHPSAVECFHLRLLLLRVLGPTSFEDLKRVDGVLHDTFRAAAVARGLLEGTHEFDLALQEAVLSISANRLRYLLATMIKYCELSDPGPLWQKYKDDLSDDILHRARLASGDRDLPFSAVIYERALAELEDVLIDLGGCTLDTYGMERPDRRGAARESREMRRETCYDLPEQNEVVARGVGQFTDDQERAYNTCIAKYEAGEGGVLFMQAAGGTGKTFTLNTILALVRGRGDVALAVAFSGIAATLLDGGRTAHSTFGLPLGLNQIDSPSCTLTKQCAQAQVLRRAKVVVWDECTMMHKAGFECLDRMLRDFRDSDALFGGLLMILAGDFRQTLPVIPQGTPADEINASLKKSYLWPHVQKVGELKTNMRSHLFGDERAAEFAEKLLEIGDGTRPVDAEEMVTLDRSVAQVVGSEEALCQAVFPDLATNHTDFGWLRERAILAPRNDEVDAVNDKLLDQIPQPSKTYLSQNTVIQEGKAVEFPTEYLDSLRPSGVPPHKLTLKLGAPVMLLRNLDPPRLCNGTRLTVVRLGSRVIDCRILTGPGAGEVVTIPRLPIKPQNITIEFKRLQFPLRLCFAMTISKSQGQSLNAAGLLLHSQPFTHGQLYVALSRVGSAKNVFVYSSKGERVANVTYARALQD